MNALEIKVGHCYEAKNPKSVGISQYFDDRQVLWISPEKDQVQYDSPEVGWGKNYKTTSMEKFLKWAGRNCTKEMPRDDWRSWPMYHDRGDVRFLAEMIRLVESTSDDEWIINVVSSKDGKQNCFFGHLFRYYANLKNERHANKMWDKFEATWATTYMIYPVNDGTNPKYQQSTPRKRILTYLGNLMKGEEKSVLQYGEEHLEQWKKENTNESKN